MGEPDPGDWVTVWYTCQLCGVSSSIETRRRRPGQPLDQWTDRVGGFVTRHHLSNHRRCRSRRFDLKIPVPAGGEPGTGPAETRPAPGPG